MSEARAVCEKCAWAGLVDVMPAWPMHLLSCPNCGRRTLGYARDVLVVNASAPLNNTRLLRTE